jgi:hypothetical protein
VLVPVERDEETWHLIDRKHIAALLSSSRDYQVTADALYLEWLDVAGALSRELEKGAYTDPDLGFKVYDSDSTLKVIALGLAKKAREAAIADIITSGRLPPGPRVYPSMLDPDGDEGTSLDKNGLRKVNGAVAARLLDCVAALKSLRGLPQGALAGFAYFISPYVFTSDMAHAFSSNQAGPEEWVGISALPPDYRPDGFPKDTIVHETGHLVHFEYMGPPDEQGPAWRQYEALRGRPLNDSGKWENLTVENFAEDFRVTFTETTLPHRGVYAAPGPELKRAISALVRQTIAAGPAGRVKITDLRLHAGSLHWPVMNAPASTGVIVTRERAVTVEGKAETLAQGVRPVLVLLSDRTPLEQWLVRRGSFEIDVPLSRQGVYALLKGYLNPETNVLWEYEPGLTILSMGPESARLGDASEHWAKRDLAVLMTLGVLGGYPSGAIRPESPITRAEFIKMLSVLMGLEPSLEKIPFAMDHWAGPYIAAAWKAGWIPQERYRTPFDPEATLTRGEMAVIIAAALGGKRASRCPFPDVPAADRPAVGYLVERGIVRGLPDGTFGARRATTRAEAATTLARLHQTLLDR